jgi:hypothetical protein
MPQLTALMLPRKYSREIGSWELIIHLLCGCELHVAVREDDSVPIEARLCKHDALRGQRAVGLMHLVEGGTRIPPAGLA